MSGFWHGWPESTHPAIIWEPVTEERYCVDSGRPVQLIPGDRCRSHGASGVMCTTAIRDPRCQHLRLSPNHPYPKCSECGRSGRATRTTEASS